MRYGLDDGQEKTLEEVGRAFNVSAPGACVWGRCGGDGRQRRCWAAPSMLGWLPCCIRCPFAPTSCQPQPTAVAHVLTCPRPTHRPHPRMQVTRERIRQIESKAIRKLRSPSRIGQLVTF